MGGGGGGMSGSISSTLFQYARHPSELVGLVVIKGIRLVSRRTSNRISVSAVLSLQRLWFVDTYCLCDFATFPHGNPCVVWWSYGRKPF